MNIRKAEDGFIIEIEGRLYVARSYLELGRKIFDLFNDIKMDKGERTGNKKIKNNNKGDLEWPFLIRAILYANGVENIQTTCTNAGLEIIKKEI